MADIGDVETALVNLASAALYPSGVGAGSPLGLNARIYRGHPGPDVLDADMQAGYTQSAASWVLTTASARVVHVCVNLRPGVGRLVRPYTFTDAQAGTIPPLTLTATVAGATVTLGGTISAGQGVAIASGLVVSGAIAGSTDTLASLATAAAAAMTAAGATAAAAGAVITVSGTAALAANTFVSVATGQEVERQVQGFVFTIYAPNRDVRDAVSALLKPYLAGMQRFTLPDGFQALMRSAPPIELDDDKPEKALLFIRNIYVQVEYATVMAGAASTQAILQQVIQDLSGNALATLVEA